MTARTHVRPRHKFARFRAAKPGAPLRNVESIEDRFYPHVHLSCGHYVEMRPCKYVIELYDAPKRIRCNDCRPPEVRT